MSWALAAAFVLAPSAHAQLGAHDRQTGASNTIGAAGAEACSRFAASGDTTDAAIETCTRSLQRERLARPTQIAVMINRGAIYLRRSDGTSALADFDAVIATEPRNAEAHLNRGAALVMLGRPGPAVAAITEALSLGVREPHKAYYNRAAAREALGDLRGAYEDYTTALDIHPDWAPAEAEIARFVRARQEHLAVMLNSAQAVTPPATP